MSILNKILDQFYSNKDNQTNLLILRLLSIINSVIIIFILIIGITNSIQLLIYPSLIILFLISVNFYLTFTKINKAITRFLYLSLIALYSVSLLIHPVIEILSIVFILFPINAFYILGNKKGNLISVMFIPVFILTIFIPYIFNFQYQLNIITSIILIFAYVVIHSILYIYEFIKENKQIRIINELNDIKKLTSQKDQFLSNLSHQIRTPLNNITVLTNLLNKPNLEPKQKDLLDTILASANNLANVVNNISEIPNIETAENAEYIINFNLFSTIESTIKIFQQNQKNLKFNLSIPPEIKSELLGNPVRLKQIFLNLIESIIKNKTESSIDIGVSGKINLKTNDSLRILFEVTSNQPMQLPINKTQKQFISPLKSTDKNKAIELINMLDLTIANRIIESENETLKIDIQDKITKFSFQLNFKKPEEKNKEQIKITDKEGSIISSDLKDKNVLLVEDNIINQKIVILSLKKAVKNIDVANNGKEALDMFGTSKYDIILMDIQMPIMNGIVTTKKIREIEASSDQHTPIIAITANALLGDKENCIAAGMDDYISKPFQIEVLLKKMKTQIEKANA